MRKLLKGIFKEINIYTYIHKNMSNTNYSCGSDKALNSALNQCEKKILIMLVPLYRLIIININNN